MRFSSLISCLTTLTTLLGAASAVEIRFYSNSYTCTGTNYAYWYNIPASTCWKSGPGDNAVHAVEFFNVPSGAKGQAYTSISDCSYYGDGGGSGTYCFTNKFYYNANWFYSSSKMRVREELEGGPSVTGFQYSTPEGETKRIACGTQDFDKVRKLLDDGDYEGLAAYPDDTVSVIHV